MTDTETATRPAEETAEAMSERADLITQADIRERQMARRAPAPAPAGGRNDGPLIAVIQKLASDPAFDVEKLRELRAIQKEWDDEQNRKAYVAALARAQTDMPIVKKNAHVFFEGKGGKADTDYWHADYGNLVKTIKPYLSREGLSYDHDVEQKDGRIHVTCTLSHEDGHKESVTLSAPPDDTGGKNPIQQTKSTTTYLKRTTLEMGSGAATEGDDDDGRAAGGATAEEELVSVEQIAKLNAKLEQTGGDRDTFLRYLRVEDIADLPAWKFSAAMLALYERAERVAADAEASEAERQADAQADLLAAG